MGWKVPCTVEPEASFTVHSGAEKTAKYLSGERTIFGEYS